MCVIYYFYTFYIHTTHIFGIPRKSHYEINHKRRTPSLFCLSNIVLLDVPSSMPCKCCFNFWTPTKVTIEHYRLRTSTPSNVADCSYQMVREICASQPFANGNDTHKYIAWSFHIQNTETMENGLCKYRL